MKQDYPGEVEILTIDDGSNDGSRRIVEQLSLKHPTLNLVSSNGSVVAEARNTELSKASRRLIVMPTSHTYVSEDFLSVLVARLM